MDLNRVNDHIYVQMYVPSCTFYVTQQLEKLYRQFAHPSSKKLYNLLKRAGLEAVDSDTLRKLEQIVSRCDPCQRIKIAPLRFRVTLDQENTRFNSKVYMNLLHLEGEYVLHIIDEATRFSAAKFVGKRVTTEKI